MGKTRLVTAVAAAVADRWSDGVWFVDLVPVTDEALVPAAVSRILGLADSPGRSSEEHVLAHLADRQALLVLDNCEHLVDGVGVFVERLLGHCPGVTVLATSQARLLLPFEQVFAVPGLSLPRQGEQGDAVSLFVERAAAGGRPAAPPADLERVGVICRRLDGSALAIELAAARLPSLGLDGIERGLGERFDLLAGGSRIDVRHQSLRSTIDWSYALLDPADQVLLRRVSVFAAPFTAEAAATVAGRLGDLDPAGSPGPAGDDARPAVAAGLARLAEHSLLVTSPGPVTRHRVLDSIRQYGLERMAEAAPPADGDDAAGDVPDELTTVRRRHHAWATAELRELDHRADVPLREALGQADEFAAWRQDFDRVADDARAALLWAHHADRRDDTFVLAHLLGSTTFTRGSSASRSAATSRPPSTPRRRGSRADALIEAAGAASSRHVGNDALRLWRAAAATAAAGGRRGHRRLRPRPGRRAAAARSRHHRRQAAPRHPPRAVGRGAGARLRRGAGPHGHRDRRGVRPRRGRSGGARGGTRGRWRRPRGSTIRCCSARRSTRLTAVDLGVGDLDGAIEASRRRTEIIAGIRASAVSAFEVGDCYHMASEVALAAGDFARARRYAEMSDHVSFHSEEGHLATSRLLKVDAMAGEIALVLQNAERFLPRVGGGGPPDRVEPGQRVVLGGDGPRAAGRRRRPERVDRHHPACSGSTSIGSTAAPRGSAPRWTPSSPCTGATPTARSPASTSTPPS